MYSLQLFAFMYKELTITKLKKRFKGKSTYNLKIYEKIKKQVENFTYSKNLSLESIMTFVGQKLG